MSSQEEDENKIYINDLIFVNANRHCFSLSFLQYQKKKDIRKVCQTNKMRIHKIPKTLITELLNKF